MGRVRISFGRDANFRAQIFGDTRKFPANFDGRTDTEPANLATFSPNGHGGSEDPRGDASEGLAECMPAM